MRKTLSNILNNLKNKNIFLLHNDLFHFETFNSINCGITEPTTISISAGLASQGKIVFVYSVAGFSLYRAFDQIKYYLTNSCNPDCKKLYKGKVILLIAGAGDCIDVYPKYMGESHRIRDDDKLAELLNVKLYNPKNKEEFRKLIHELLKKDFNFCIVRLGRDDL